MRTIESGKHKGKTLNECPESYIIWASKHEKNFSESNRWVSRKAKELLAQMAQEQKAQAVAASKIEHMESLAKGGSFLAQMDLAMTNFIVAAAPKYPVNKHGISDISMVGNLSSNKPFSILR